MSVAAVIVGCLLAMSAAALLFLRTQLAVITVRGTSMLPAFQPGDRVLVRRGRAGSRTRQLRAGTVIVVRSPAAPPAPRGTWPVAPPLGWDKWVIKRVAALSGDAVPGEMSAAVSGAVIVPDGKLLVAADNPAGADSRQWGFIEAGSVLGLVVTRLSA
jgi:signal peptidase I